MFLRKRDQRSLLLLASCALLLASSSTWAAVYYVQSSCSGCNANSCPAATNPTTPKQTINAGISCLSGGDTLIVKSGTYVEAINGANIPNGTAGAHTTIQAEVPRQALLQPTNAQLIGGQKAVLIFGETTNQHYITVRGLLFDLINANQGGRIWLHGDTGSDDILLDNIEIKNRWMLGDDAGATGEAISWSSMPNSILRGSSVHDIGLGSASNTSFWAYGIYGWAGIVETSEFYNITGYALHQYTSGGRCDNQIVRGNFFRDTGPLLLGWCSAGSSGNQVYNNLLLRVGSAAAFDSRGFNLRGGPNLYVNNTIANGGKSGASGQNQCFQVDGDNNTIRNNICYGGVNDIIQIQGGRVGNVLSNNLLSTPDPLFVTSPPQVPADLKLQAGSPAKDAGTNASPIATTVTTDYFGTARPQPAGGAWDIGGAEVSGGSAVIPSQTAIAWWKFDAGSGISAVDATGNGHTLTWTTGPGPGWGAGRVGPKSLACDGSAVSAQLSEDIPIGNAYSWSLWFQSPTAPTISVDQQIFYKGTQFGMFWSSNDACCVVATSHRQASGTYLALKLPGALAANTWYHLGGVWDGSTLRLYQNGVEQASTAVSTVSSNGAGLKVCAPQGTGLVGTVDDVKLWNRALSTTEVQQEYRSGAGMRRHSTSQALR